jgi:3-oxoacyl-[acyl-carrier protein] reductase
MVTGATSGIGRAICRALNEEGYVVVAHYHRDRPGALELQELIQADGGACELVQSDLGEPDGPATAARSAVAALRGVPLHGVVNNAATLLGPVLEEISVADFDRFFALNTRAPLLLAKELLPHLRVGSSIVNISSASAHLSSPGNLLYAMSKAALESFTRNLAEAIAPKGVRVNAVVPGFTDNGHAAFSDPVALEYMSSFSPLGGVGSPETVAHAVSFLLSPLSSRTTGSLVDVSGGMTLAPRGTRAKSVRDVLPGSSVAS